MWMQHRFDRLADFAQAALELGFGGIEVSHIVTPEMIGGDDPATLAIRSVHYPAPTALSPFGRPADALLASADATARQWAVAQGRASIDFAAKAGATALCLHLGEVTMPLHLEWALRQRYLGGQRGASVYAKARAELEQARADRAEPALAAAQRSLDELADYARPRGVRLGIESRFHYHEIPIWRELDWLLRCSDPAVVGFWYDLGHVQVLHNLGLHEQQAWLAAFAQRIVGVHFHDVVGLRDHLIPGLGELDYGAIAAFIPARAARTCEFDWYFSAEEVQQGACYLAANGCLEQ
jgi:sugar phosphate isomerase/epimerase